MRVQSFIYRMGEKKILKICYLSKVLFITVAYLFCSYNVVILLEFDDMSEISRLQYLSFREYVITIIKFFNASVLLEPALKSYLFDNLITLCFTFVKWYCYSSIYSIVK